MCFKHENAHGWALLGVSWSLLGSSGRPWLRKYIFKLLFKGKFTSGGSLDFPGCTGSEMHMEAIFEHTYRGWQLPANRMHVFYA